MSTEAKLEKVKSSETLRRVNSSGSLNAHSIDENLAKYTFSQEEFKERLSSWHKEGWPVPLLVRDHYSAKILEDNGIFKSIKFYGHTWKWDEDEGLVILYKHDDKSETTWTKWVDIVNNLNIKKTSRGDFILEGASYGKDGFEYEKCVFQFTAADFKSMLNKWVAEGWPVQFLLRDHYGAKVLFDNQVFSYTEFYGHGWKWDDEKGLSILFKRTLSTKSEFVPWDEIKQLIPICRTAQGWLLFDGWNYVEEGLLPSHLWQWKKLNPIYHFPTTRCPNYCYVDFVTFNWEHEGLPGIGFDSTPHGHTSVEFGDDEGAFYSIGFYMDPRSMLDMKKTPAATLRGALMVPDPYLPSKGEKTIHRYHVGQGKEGRENIAKLRKHIETIQGYRKDAETGIVSTLRSRKYHTFQFNCGDFQKELEEYVRRDLGGKLHKPDETAVFVPRRIPVKKSTTSRWKESTTHFWNIFLLFLLDFIIFIATSAPWVSAKMGVGQEDDFSDRTDDEVLFPVSKNPQVSGSIRELGLLTFLAKNFSAVVPNLVPRPVSFPRRHRVEQLYSPRLKNHTVTLKT